MKRLFVFVFLTLGVFAAESVPPLGDVSTIDGLVEGIKQAPRPAMPNFRNAFFSSPGATRVQQPAAKSELKLQSIIANRALIGGAWRQAGDRVNGYQIDAIYPDFVILNRGGKEMKLLLAGVESKSSYIKKAGGQ